MQIALFLNNIVPISGKSAISPYIWSKEPYM